MSVTFGAILAALLSERVGDGVGRKVLAPLCGVGVASVLYWHATELAGAGDLRPYLLVQVLPLAAVPLVLALFPARRRGAGQWMFALGLYAVAKALEVLDRPALDAVGVSGHTLKHVAAALATAWLARMIWKRPAPPYSVVSQLAQPQCPHVRQPPDSTSAASHCGHRSPFRVAPLVRTCFSREPSR